MAGLNLQFLSIKEILIMTLLKYIIAICFFTVVFLSINVSAQTLQDKTLNRSMTAAEAGNFFSPSLVNDVVGKPWRYGDGDVNHDGKTDSLDLSIIDSVDSTAHDQRDIDGDGVYTQHDKSLLQDYLGGEDSIPIKAWPQLTKEQKISWLEKMIKIDKTDTIKVADSSTYDWACSQYVKQGELNFRETSDPEGYRDYLHSLQDPSPGTYYFIDKNARFGIPIFSVGTTDDLQNSHAVCGAFVGDNPLNFDDWYFWDIYSDRRVLPGDPAMDPNKNVTIGGDGYWEKGVDGIPFEHYGPVPGIISFYLTDGKVTQVSHKNFALLEDPYKARLNFPPNGNGGLEGILLDYKDVEGKEITPELLKSLGKKAVPDTSTENVYWPTFLNYKDSEKKYSEDSTSYSFDRQWYFGFDAGGLTFEDSLETPQNITVDNLTAVDDYKAGAREFKVYQNYPNPFNPTTTIKYSIPFQSFVSINIYDELGELVYSLFNGIRQRGDYSIKIDRKNLSSGVYFCRIEAAGSYTKVNFTKTLKMILMK